ncbi:MAG: putative NAD(P)/FAD-binding protein YdhS [Myxococcota bacterium]|jgi:uncharacterized NAD(P)/FAD-binding protein YdhS
MKSRPQPQRSVLYLSESALSQANDKSGTLLVRMLRRQLEAGQQQTRDAITVADTLKAQNLVLVKSLKEANARNSLLERQLERSKRPSRRGINNNIDALAARLVSGNTA